MADWRDAGQDSGSGASTPTADWRGQVAPGTERWAPDGFLQSANRIANAEPNWRGYVDRTNPTWETGGQTGSTLNSFQTNDFYNKMYRVQQDATAQKINPTDMENFTGIAVYKGKGRHIGDFNAGDVFIDGKKVEGAGGNVYTAMDETGANSLMADLTLDPTIRADLYRTYGGDQAKIRARIDQEATKYASDIEDFQSSQAFEKRVQERKAEIQGDEAANFWTNLRIGGTAIGGAAATGALTGAGLTAWSGPGAGIGGLLGGIVGGALGAFNLATNYDEMLDQVVRAEIENEMAEETPNNSPIRTVLNTVSADFRNASVFTNLAQGIVTSAQVAAGNDEFNDNRTVAQAALEREDEAALNIWTGASIAGGVADIGATILGPAGIAKGVAAAGVGSAQATALTTRGVQAITNLGRIPYMGNLTTEAASKLNDATLAGNTFNERTGRYQDLDLGGRAALVGAAAIDVVQVGRPLALLGRMLPNSKLASGMTKWEEASGFRFAPGVAENAVRVRPQFATFVAPSEMFPAMVAATVATKTVLSNAPGAMTFSKALYEAASRTAQSSKLSSIVVTATSEGMEEVGQEFLEQYALQDFDMTSIALAGVAGVLGGAVIATPTTMWRRTQSRKDFEAYSEQLTRLGITPQFTKEQWEQLPPRQQQEATRTAGMLTDAATGEAANLFKMNTAIARNIDASNPLATAMRGYLRAQEEKARENSALAVSPSKAFALAVDPLIQPYQVQSGHENIVDLYQIKLRNLRAATNQEPEVIAQLEMLISELRTSMNLFWQHRNEQLRLQRQAREVGDKAAVQQIKANLAGGIEEFTLNFNKILQNAWDSTDLNLHRAAALGFKREPRDGQASTIFMLPQTTKATLELQLGSQHPVTTISFPSYVYKGMSADNDGDRNILFDVMPNEEQHINYINGVTRFYGIDSSRSIEVEPSDRQAYALDNLQSLYFEGNKKELEQVNNALTTLQQRVGQILDGAQVKDRVIFDRLFSQLADSPTASTLEDFWKDLGSSTAGVKLIDYGTETKTDYFGQIDRAFERFAYDIADSFLSMDSRTQTQRITPTQATPSLNVIHRQNPISAGAVAASDVANLTESDEVRRAGNSKNNESTIASFEAAANELLRGDISIYRAMETVSTGEARSEAELALNSEPVLRRAQMLLTNTLVRLNRERAQIPGTKPLQYLHLFVLAPNDQGKSFARLAIDAAASWTLKEEAEPNSPDIQQKYRKYQNPDMYQVAAMLLEHRSGEELIGQKAVEYHLNGSLRANRLAYQGKSPEQRRVWDDIMKTSTDFHRNLGEGTVSAEDGWLPTVTEIWIGLVREAGRTLSHDPKTGKVNTTYGLGKRDREFGEQRLALRAQMRQYFLARAKDFQSELNSRGIKFTGKLTAPVINEVFGMSGDLATLVVNSFDDPESTVDFMFAPDGRLRETFVDYLSIEDDNQAMAHVWRVELLAELDKTQRLGTVHSSSDRIVQFLAAARRLDNPATFTRAMQVINDATNVNTAIAELNMLVTDGPTLLPWLRDISYLNPTEKTGGWGLTMPEVKLREAYQKLSASITHLDGQWNATLNEDAKKQFLELKTLASNLRQDDPKKYTGALNSLQARLNHLRGRQAHVGPRMIMNALVATANIQSGQASKGIANMGFEALGLFEAAGKNLVFGAGLMNIAADLTGISVDSLRMHPEILLTGGMIQEEDGNSFYLEPLTAYQWVKLAQNPAMFSVMNSLLDPLAYDISEDGTHIQPARYSSLTDGHALGLASEHQLEGATGLSMDKLRTPELDTRISNGITLTRANELTRNGEWMQLLLMTFHRNLSQRTGTTAPDTWVREQAQQAMHDIDRIAQEVSLLSEAHRDIFIQDLQDHLDGGYMNPNRQDQIKLFETNLQNFKKEMAAEYNFTEAQVDNAFKDIVANVTGISAERRLMERYTPSNVVNGKMEFSDEQKLQLQDLWATYVQYKATWVRDKNQAQKARIDRMIKNPKQPTDLSNDDFAYMANVLLRREMDRYLPRHGQDLNLLPTKDDPAGTHGELTESDYKYLLRGLAENRGGMLDAARSLAADASQLNNGHDVARRAIALLNPDTELFHNSITVTRTIAALNSYQSRAAEAGIQSAGLLVPRFGALATLSNYDYSYVVSEDDRPRTAVLSIDDLDSSNQPTYTAIRPDTAGQPFTVADLYGLNFTDLQVTFRSEDGDLATHRLEDLGIVLQPVAGAIREVNPDAAAWRTTTPRSLHAQLTQKAAELDMTIETVSLSFFHPDDAPVPNVAVYLGHPNLGVPDKSDTPIQSLTPLIKDMSRDALDATKLHQSALLNATTPRDYGKLLHTLNSQEAPLSSEDVKAFLTSVISQHMAVEDAWSGTPTPDPAIHGIRAMYTRMVNVRVRYQTAAGEKIHVFTSTEWMSKEGDLPATAPADMQGAEILKTDVVTLNLDKIQAYSESTRAVAEQTMFTKWNQASLRSVAPGIYNVEKAKRTGLQALERSTVPGLYIGTLNLNSRGYLPDRRVTDTPASWGTRYNTAALLRTQAGATFKQQQDRNEEMVTDLANTLPNPAEVLAGIPQFIRDQASFEIPAGTRAQHIQSAKSQEAREAEKARLRESLTWVLRTPWDLPPARERARDFEKTLAELKADPKVASDAAPYDLVVLFVPPVSEVDSNEVIQEKTTWVVEQAKEAMAAGYYVSITDTGDSAIVGRARTELRREGYPLVPDTMYFQQYTNKHVEYRDQMVLEDTLGAQPAVSSQNRALLWLDPAQPGLESLRWFHNQNAEPLTTYVHDQIVPIGHAGGTLAHKVQNSTGYTRAQQIRKTLLNEIAAIDAVKGTDEKPVTPMLDHLVKLSETVNISKTEDSEDSGTDQHARRDLIRSIRKLKYYNEIYLLPDITNHKYRLESGDILFEVVGTQVYLNRIGKKTVGRAQLNAQYAAELDDRAGMIAISGTRENQQSTVIAGPLQSYELVGAAGIRMVTGEVLPEEFTKIVERTWKATSTPGDAERDGIRIPRTSRYHEALAGRDTLAKQADELTIGNFSDDAAIFGVSFTEAIINTLGVESEAGVTPQERHATAVRLIEQQRGQLRAKAMYYSNTELVDLLSDMARVNDVIEAVHGVALDGATVNERATSAEQQITTAIIMASMADGAQIPSLIHVDGLLQQASTAAKPQIHTNVGSKILAAFIDNAPRSTLTSVGAVREYYLGMLQENLRRFNPALSLVENGQRIETRDNTGKVIASRVLRMPVLHVSPEDSSVVVSQSFDRKERQDTTWNMEWAAYLFNNGAQPAQQFEYQPREHPLLDGSADFTAVYHTLGEGISDPIKPAQGTGEFELAQYHREQLLEVMQPIESFADASDNPRRAANLDSARQQFADEYFAGNRDLVDYLVRTVQWRGHKQGAEEGSPESGFVTMDEYAQALDVFQKNLDDGRFPTFGLKHGAMPSSIVAVMANQAYSAKGWVPKNEMEIRFFKNNRQKNPSIKTEEVADPLPEVASREDYIQYFMDISIAEMYNTVRHELDRNIFDVMLQTYDSYYSGETLGYPLARAHVEDMGLMNMETHSLVQSIDVSRQVSARREDVLDSNVFMKYRSDFITPFTTPGTIADLARHQMNNQMTQRQRKFLAKNNVKVSADNVSGADFRRGNLAKKSRDQGMTTSLANTLVAASVLQRVADPAVILSSSGELMLRMAPERLADFLTGGEVPWLARNSRVGANFRQAALNNGLMARIKQDAFDDSLYNVPGVSSFGKRINTWTRKWLRAQAWFRSDKSLMLSFQNSLTRTLEAYPDLYPNTIVEALAELTDHPDLFIEQNPWLYRMAMTNTIGGLGMQQTLPGFLAGKAIHAATTTDSPGLNAAVNLTVRGPAAFFNYFTNVSMNVLGLRTANNVLSLGAAMMLSRAKSERYRNTAEGMLEQTLAELSFANAFVRDGVTWTGLAIGGLLLQGFLGDDDELRRKLEMRRQGIITANDVRSLENDWRNADALYLEGTPLEFLKGIFTTSIDPETGETESPFLPSWFVNQFVYPFIGLSKFAQTGDFEQITIGFQRALGNMPLSYQVASFFGATADVNQTLFANLNNTQGEQATLQDVSDSYNGFAKILMNYERLYMEWGFLNRLYAGLDPYVRNPFARVDLDADGNPQSDKLGQPMETSATTRVQLPDGTMYDATAGYTDPEAWFRVQAQERVGMGLLASGLSIFTGNANLALRFNMPVSVEQIQRGEITTEEDFEDAILALYDVELGHEVLTADGYAAVANSLHTGLLRVDQVEGIYATYETRRAVAEKFIERWTAEGLEAGLSPYDAKSNALYLMYGDENRPYIRPMYDIIMSRNDYQDVIPYTPTVGFVELNTTFAKGPSGDYYATGVNKNDLLGLVGLSPMQKYSGLGTQNQDIQTDNRLNTVDPSSNLNTGRRALERINETIDTISDEDILDGLNDAADRVIDAFEKMFQGDPDGYDRYARTGRGGSGGGGGGSGYSRSVLLPYFNGMRPQYWDNIPTIYANNPMIRRASIRRERFYSDRGRLKQWQ